MFALYLKDALQQMSKVDNNVFLVGNKMSNFFCNADKTNLLCILFVCLLHNFHCDRGCIVTNG